MDIALFLLMAVSVYFAGRLAQHRGRSFTKWAWAATAIGPLALLVLLLIPDRHASNGAQSA